MRHNMRSFVRHECLTRFLDYYIKVFKRSFSCTREINMYQTSITSNRNYEGELTTERKFPKEDKTCLNGKNDKEGKHTIKCDIAEDMKAPANFSAEEKEIFEAHKRAIEADYDTYTDPRTGYDVFTRASLLNRGTCCGNACRHCPFDQINVPEHLRTKTFNSQFYI